MLISLGWKFLFFFFRGLINAFHEYEWIEIMDKYELNDLGNLIKKKKNWYLPGNIPSIEFCWYNILEDKNERKMAIYYWLVIRKEERWLIFEYIYSVSSA